MKSTLCPENRLQYKSTSAVVTPVLCSNLADLHRHLDGSLRESTLLELAAEVRLHVPNDFRFRVGMGLAEALACFTLTVASLQSSRALRRVVSEICEDAAAEGVATLEIRFAPQLHCGSQIEMAVDSVLEGIRGRAGLILCGLYGEPPSVLERLVDVAASRPGVVGLDLAGGPLATHAFRLTDYVRAFRRAGDLGLGRTVHAAEGRSPDEIRTAIEDLGVDRIGHGTTLLDDLAIVDLVLERDVAIEACITSNLHTGAVIAVDRHPLPRWLTLSVRACINTDNTLLSNVTAASEFARAAQLPGMTSELLHTAVANGHAAAFRRNV